MRTLQVVVVTDDFVDTIGWTTDPELASCVLQLAQRVLDKVRDETIQAGDEWPKASGTMTRVIQDAVDRTVATEHSKRIVNLEHNIATSEGECARLTAALTDATRTHEVAMVRVQCELDSLLSLIHISEPTRPY